MGSQHEDAPEVSPLPYPEVYHPPRQEVYAHYQSVPPTPMKPEESPHPGLYAYGHDASTLGYRGTESVVPDEREQREQLESTVCGCSLLVFVLSVVIAMLAATVIGLAAGVGVEANRAEDAESKVSELSASIAALEPTKTGAVPAETGFAALTNNCSLADETTTGQTYTTQFFGNVTFVMYCNEDTPHNPLVSVFSQDFNTCMDSCASYNSYNLTANATSNRCGAVSFIPLWTTKPAAVAGKAPGNCYLKPSPVNSTMLKKPNIGTECHAGILSNIE